MYILLREPAYLFPLKCQYSRDFFLGRKIILIDQEIAYCWHLCAFFQCIDRDWMPHMTNTYAKAHIYKSFIVIK